MSIKFRVLGLPWKFEIVVIYVLVISYLKIYCQMPWGKKQFRKGSEEQMPDTEDLLELGAASSEK